MNEEFKFDFNFGSTSSDEMLNRAKKELLGLQGIMGEGDTAETEVKKRETAAFFAELESGKLEFPRANPTVFPLNIAYFKQNGLGIPKNFKALSAQAKFYWVEMPVFLSAKKPFYKVQMWMEFGEGISKGKEVPQVHSAFPESKFVEKATVEGKFVFGLGEDLEFKVAAGIDDVALPSNIPVVEASTGGKLAVDAKAASNFGFAVKPFLLTLKRAIVECRFAGEKVFWTITDKQSLQENNPVFMVILQVPKGVKQVQLKAQAQAHRMAPLPRYFLRLLDKISPDSAEWLKKGSPIALPPHSYPISTQ